jgi:hypothetical protein
MSLSEKKGWAVYRSLDVSYVFVVFGGYIGKEFILFSFFLFLRARGVARCRKKLTLKRPSPPLSPSPDSFISFENRLPLRRHQQVLGERAELSSAFPTFLFGERRLETNRDEEKKTP